MIRPYSTECFTEYPNESQDLITGSFFTENVEVYNGKEAKFDMSVTDQNANEIYNAIGENEHRFEYQVNQAGTVKVCFKNTGSRTEKLTYFSHIGHHWDHGKATKIHLDPALEALQNLDSRVASVAEESRYHKRRANRHAMTTTSTQSRVTAMAIVEGVVMITCTAFQLFYVKRLFGQKENFDRGRARGERFGV